MTNLKELQEQKMKEFDKIMQRVDYEYHRSYTDIKGEYVMDLRFVDRFIQQATQEAWNSAVEACIGALPKEKEYMWENGECTICGYNSYYSEDVEHYCETYNTCIKQSITNLNQLKGI